MNTTVTLFVCFKNKVDFMAKVNNARKELTEAEAKRTKGAQLPIGGKAAPKKTPAKKAK